MLDCSVNEEMNEEGDGMDEQNMAACGKGRRTRETKAAMI